MSTPTHRGTTSVADEETGTTQEETQPAGTSKRSALQGMQTYRIAGVLSALVAVFVIFTILEPSFIKFDNISEIVVQSSIIAVVALGMTLVIVTGGIDLSVGSIVAVVSVVCATNLPHWGTPLTILIGLASFIVTLATLNLYRGVAFLYTDGKPIFSISETFRNVFAGKLFGIQIPILLVLIITALCAVMLSSTRLGLSLRAVGSNTDASRKSGVRVKRAQATAFVLSGLLSALAALMLMGRVGAAEPITGTGYELIAIAAVVVGGTSLMGGRASVVGTLLGALLLGAIRTGLTLHNVNPYVSYVVTGLIILVAVLVDRFISRKQRIA